MKLKSLFPSLPHDPLKRFLVVAVLLVVLVILQFMNFEQSTLPIPHYRAPFVSLKATPACLTSVKMYSSACVSEITCVGLVNPFTHERGFPLETNLYNYFYADSCLSPDYSIHWGVQVFNWIFDAVILYAIYLGMIYIFNNEQAESKHRKSKLHKLKIKLPLKKKKLVIKI